MWNLAIQQHNWESHTSDTFDTVINICLSTIKCYSFMSYWRKMMSMFPVSTPCTSEWLCSNGILSWKFPKSIGSYTLVGRSRAADATSLFIPELDMLLDCGCLVTVTRPLYIFITHSHSDHCLDITRLLSRTRPPQVYLPVSAVQPMQDYIEKCQILRAAGRIDPEIKKGTNHCWLVPFTVPCGLCG